MIAIMRRLIHSNVYKIFLWAFLLMMALGSGVAFINIGESKDWVLKAYKQTMTQQKFQNTLKQAKQQQESYRQKGYNFANQNIEKETVQGCIGGLLSQHAMDRVGFMVPASLIHTQMQQQLQHLPPYFFQGNGELDVAIFNRTFAPMTIDEFIAGLEIEAKNKLLLGLVDATVYTPEFEVALQYNSEFANKDYSYIALPYQKYLAQARTSVPSDEALNKFYKKPSVADTFRTMERRAGTVWTFHASEFGINVSDSEVKQFYDKNKMQRYVVHPATMQVRTLLVKIEPAQEAQAKLKIEELSQQAQKDPAQFEALVRKFSQDPKAAVHGGLTEFFAKDDKKIDPMILDMAFEFLTTDGQISTPIKTAHGYELVQRVAKKQATYKEFKSVEAEIRKELITEKFKKRFAQDANRVVTSAKYNPETLTKFITRYKGTVSQLPLDARKPGIESTYLFKIQEGRYTSFLDKDKGIILLCSQVEKSKLPALSEVKAQVTSMYHEDQAFGLLRKQLAAVFADASRMNLQDVAQKYGATVQQATFTYKNGKAEQSAILKEPEVAASLKNLQHIGAMVTVETKRDGILLKLDRVAPRDQALFDEQKEHLSKIMFYMKMYQIKEGFIASLYRTAKLNNKIEIKNELLQLTKEV